MKKTEFRYSSEFSSYKLNYLSEKFYKHFYMQQLSIGCFGPTNFKHAFSPQEDEMLRRLVSIYGDKEWKLVAQKMPNRTTRQCRERYKSYLAPDIKNGPWTPEEDELLKQKYNEYGSKWSKIQSFFISRSDVNIKNRWTIISGKKNKAKAYIIKSIDDPNSSSLNKNSDSISNAVSVNDEPIPILKNNQDDNMIDNNFYLQLNKSLNIQQNVINQPKSPMLFPSSPINIAQTSSPGIQSTGISIHNSFSDRNQSSTLSIQYSNPVSNLPLYKKQRQLTKGSVNDLIISSSNDKRNEKESEYSIKNISNKSPEVKKHLIPPISSLSIPSEDKLLIPDRLILPFETRIDESFIATGPNLTLANNFTHYGGNIW